MKKTRKQRAFEDKHLIKSNLHYQPYMAKIRRKAIKGKRFKMGRFKKTVTVMLWEHDNILFFSGRIASNNKGVSISFPSRKVRIVSSYN